MGSELSARVSTCKLVHLYACLGDARRPSKCKAAAVIGDGRITLVDDDIPPLRRGSVLIEVHNSLVSPGTELGGWHVLRKKAGQPPAPPRKFGYSNAGIVLEVAGGAGEFEPGDRVAADAQRQRGVTQWFYSTDFNARCPNVQYLLDFLARVREANAACSQRIQYIEQPTSRYLKQRLENKMHEAAGIKPVVIDEALVDFEHLLLSMELGYSGVALKTCKGQSQALLMAAAALKYNLFLCVQDLTLVGASFLHSAGLCARVPRVAAIEGNGRQYVPAANKGWEEHWPSVFKVRDGTLGTGALTLNGLGHYET